MPAANEKPPDQSYAAILTVFVGGLAVAGALERVLGRTPQARTTLDLIVLAGATFKSARTLSHDRIASFVREPFVEVQAGTDEERPEGQGLRRAIGELVTCSRCAGTWAAAGLLTTQIVAPRFGRILTWSLGAAAANDFLQAGFSALCEETDRDEG